MRVKFKMNSIISLLFSLACASSSVLGDESYHGMGSMKCYGDMSITLGGNEDEGFLNSQPGAPRPPLLRGSLLTGLTGHTGSPWTTRETETVTEQSGTSTETWDWATVTDWL